MRRPAAAAARPALAAAALLALTGCAASDPAVAPVPQPASPQQPAPATTAADPSADSTAAVCGRRGRVVRVADTAALQQALAQARPGTTIQLAAGTYEAPFTASGRRGTRDRPIALCGDGHAATIVGRSGDYGLHLVAARWWVVAGLTVSGGQKGIVLDNTSQTTITDTTISATDQEALHLRTDSSDNTVSGVRIFDTGRVDPEFGEGVYIGSARSNWCRYTSCEPDSADRNVVRDSTFGPDITAEAIDVKEGTTGTIIEGNRFDGIGMTAADSWVDIKGNDTAMRDNTGAITAKDGIQVHVAASGWGQRAVITANTMTIDAPGYGVFVESGATAEVSCTNTATGADAGLTNVTCS